MTQPPDPRSATTPPRPARAAGPRPPAAPPPGVRDPLLWRLAACVCFDHQPFRLGGTALCACCGAPWPCRPRRLAGHALARAQRDPQPGRRRRGGRPRPDRDEPGSAR